MVECHDSRPPGITAMFRSFISSVRRPIIWLMLPVALVAGRPAAGCVCPDGSVKTFCCQSDWLFPGLKSASRQPNNCCEGQTSSCSNCCNSQHGSLAKNSAAHLIDHDCQCHSLPNNVLVPEISKWSEDMTSYDLAMPAYVLVLQYAVRAPGLKGDQAKFLPPPDRVVLFLHLVI